MYNLVKFHFMKIKFFILLIYKYGLEENFLIPLKKLKYCYLIGYIKEIEAFEFRF